MAGSVGAPQLIAQLSTQHVGVTQFVKFAKPFDEQAHPIFDRACSARKPMAHSRSAPGMSSRRMSGTWGCRGRQAWALSSVRRRAHSAADVAQSKLTGQDPAVFEIRPPRPRVRGTSLNGDNATVIPLAARSALLTSLDAWRNDKPGSNRNEQFRVSKNIPKTRGQRALVTASLLQQWAIKLCLTIVGFNGRMRACKTCQHLKRPEIDRRLAAGEPLTRVAQDYGLTLSSVYRHRTNCLKLASSNTITKEAARGTAAMVLLPSKETLSGAYFELRDRIDQIARQAEQQGSLKVALAGLNSIRQTLDSLARLAGHDGADVNVAVQANVHVDVSQIVELRP